MVLIHAIDIRYAWYQINQRVTILYPLAGTLCGLLHGPSDRSTS